MTVRDDKIIRFGENKKDANCYFRRGGTAPEAGVVVGDRVVGLSGAGYDSVLSVIANYEGARAAIEALVKSPRRKRPRI